MLFNSSLGLSPVSSSSLSDVPTTVPATAAVEVTKTATMSTKSSFIMPSHRKSLSIFDKPSSYHDIIHTLESSSTIPVRIGPTQDVLNSNSLTETIWTETSSLTNTKSSSVPEMQISTPITSLPIVTELITSMYSITSDTMATIQGTQSKLPYTSHMTNLYKVSTTYMSVLQPTATELVSSTSTQIQKFNTRSSQTTNAIDGMKSSSMTKKIETISIITTSFVMVTSSNGKISTGTPKLSKSSQIDHIPSHVGVSVSGLTSITDGLVSKTNVPFKQSSHHKTNSSSHNKCKWILHTECIKK